VNVNTGTDRTHEAFYASWWFVDGDDLIAALQELQLQLSPPPPSSLAQIKFRTWYRLTSVVLENGHLTSVVLVVIIYRSWKCPGLGVGMLDLVFVSDGTGLLTYLSLSLSPF